MSTLPLLPYQLPDLRNARFALAILGVGIVLALLPYDACVWLALALGIAGYLYVAIADRGAFKTVSRRHTPLLVSLSTPSATNGGSARRRIETVPIFGREPSYEDIQCRWLNLLAQTVNNVIVDEGNDASTGSASLSNVLADGDVVLYWLKVDKQYGSQMVDFLGDHSDMLCEALGAEEMEIQALTDSRAFMFLTFRLAD